MRFNSWAAVGFGIILFLATGFGVWWLTNGLGNARGEIREKPYVSEIRGGSPSILPIGGADLPQSYEECISSTAVNVVKTAFECQYIVSEKDAQLYRKCMALGGIEDRLAVDDFRTTIPDAISCRLIYRKSF